MAEKKGLFAQYYDAGEEELKKAQKPLRRDAIARGLRAAYDGIENDKLQVQAGIDKARLNIINGNGKIEFNGLAHELLRLEEAGKLQKILEAEYLVILGKPMPKIEADVE